MAAVESPFGFRAFGRRCGPAAWSSVRLFLARPAAYFASWCAAEGFVACGVTRSYVAAFHLGDLGSL